MAVFDPNDWRGLPWLSRERRAFSKASTSRELLVEWLTTVAFCTCFAALAPPSAFLASLAGLLMLSGVVWAVVGVARGSANEANRLTPWDAALMSVTLGFGARLLS
jgi:hypothetical protein